MFSHTLETERLILRPFLPTDAEGIFELDSDPEVHTYLGRKPITTIDQARQVIDYIRGQYERNGIGRWAVLEKDSGNFVGWSGIKLVNDDIVNGHEGYYDIGYRFVRKYWGKGYATETASVSRDYAFTELKLDDLYSYIHAGNLASQRVMSKTGLKYIESFVHEEEEMYWYRMGRDEWELLR